jgi:exonuclease SbcC
LEDQQKKILKELEKKIKIGEDIEKVLRHDLRPTLDKLRKEADNQRKAYEKANDDIKEIDRQKKTAEDRLEEALKQIRGNNASLVAFLAQHPEMNETKLSELDKFTLESISKTRNEIAEQKDQVETRKTTWKIESDNLNKHLKTKPEMMEEDTLTNLGKRIADYEEEDKTINQQIGALNNDLEKDEENRQKLGQRKEEENAAKKEFDKWERLNQLIGSADGKKFRGIAQSYVLSSLIHSANSYMRTLTDRYTLKVSPGTYVILLEDAYQGFATRAASTISGGESFLVSLSLALALSDIGQKLSVNTLFIDEGFGTLSGEPLQNAITTLRTLHDKSGRHVGIISHIEELKERIPVQIQVNQDSGSSSSTIKIVP